ncbi:MAG TPA: RNA polymerase sigma factor [Candidatus Ozemobacteraceae bacterium]|nr:RNA polymerase sigma factor [Candidatus Ozemobacteraceae bacterium]
MPEISDLIIERACSGDRKAFEEIYRAHSGMVYNVAFRMTGHLETAGEITQDVFMAVFRKLAQFRGQSKLKTWIYRITVNTALNLRRREAVEKERLRAYAVEKKVLEPQVTPQPGDEPFDRVQELMMFLPPEQRVCMLLRSIEQLGYQEIADILEININTVRTRLKRARESLFAKLRGGTHEL